MDEEPSEGVVCNQGLEGCCPSQTGFVHEMAGDAQQGASQMTAGAILRTSFMKAMSASDLRVSGK